MQTQILGNLKRGIDRTRYRGQIGDGALYNLQNAYVTIAGHVKKRPPFVKVATLPATTKGLFSNDGTLHTFYTGAVQTSPMPSLIVFHALQPPVVPPPAAQPVNLIAVYFDALFIGNQYVIAEFDDNVYRHYWLSSTSTWAPDTQYNVDSVVQPTVPNGYYYKPANTQFPQAWQPNTTYKVGDVVVPTTMNGWKYTCIEADGTNPCSSTVEPTWPTSNGATVAEDTAAGQTTTQAPSSPGTPVPPRYGNLPGGGSGGYLTNGLVRTEVE